jgi:hypothetical protein
VATYCGGLFQPHQKEQIVETLSEVGEDNNLAELAKLKKADLATEAEKRLAGSRWLPSVLRA